MTRPSIDKPIGFTGCPACDGTGKVIWEEGAQRSVLPNSKLPGAQDCGVCAAHARAMMPSSVEIYLRVLAKARGPHWRERQPGQQRKARRVARAERRIRAKARVGNLIREAR